MPLLGVLLPASTGRARSDERDPLLLLAILAVSLGIVAMHMLSVGHHAPAAAHPAPGSHQSMTDPAEHPAPAGDLRNVAPTLVPMSAAVLLECGPGCHGDLGSASAACMVALALLTLVRRPHQVAERVRAPLPDRAMLRLLVHGVRTQAPRPPSLTALGISRT
jgi:hypothetical protein